MKGIKTFGVGILLLAILSGCNLPRPTIFNATPIPTANPTPVPTLAPTSVPTQAQVGAECLVGSWDMQGLEEFIVDILPQDLLQENQVQFEGVTGRIRYTFDANGHVTAAPEDLVIQARAQRGFISVGLDATIVGSVSADYEVDDTANQIHFSNPRNNTLTLSVKVGGVRVVDDITLDSMLVFGAEGEPEALINYQCTGNTLRLSVDLGEQNGTRLLNFSRVS